MRHDCRKVSNILRICLLKKAFKAKIRLRLTDCQRRNRVAASQALPEQKDVFSTHGLRMNRGFSPMELHKRRIRISGLYPRML